MSKQVRVWIVVSLLALGVVVVGLNSLRRPERMIEASLLSMAPLGSQKEEVLHALEQKGLRPARVLKVGFVKTELRRPMEVVGVSSIEAHLGDYSYSFFF